MTTADDVILMTFYQLVGGEWGGGSGGGGGCNKEATDGRRTVKKYNYISMIILNVFRS